MIWHCISSIEYWSLFNVWKYLYQLSYYSYLIKVGFGRESEAGKSGFAWVALLLINIARIGRFGLEKLFYEHNFLEKYNIFLLLKWNTHLQVYWVSWKVDFMIICSYAL